MKCPTCGYIGFETSDRCRNCGYDFGHATPPPPAPDLSLHEGEAEGALQELAIRGDAPTMPPPVARRPPRGSAATAREPDLDKVLQNLDRVLGEPPSAADLPLFDSAADGVDLAPLVDGAAPPRRPLSVRRTTPDPARLRPKPVRHSTPAPQPLELPLPDATEAVGVGMPRESAPAPEPQTGAVPAPPIRRALAAALDLAILAAIDWVVVYFTLRMCGLTTAEIAVLPKVPLAAFFLIVNGGYLAAFTAAGGQTIGKMAFGLRVVAHADLPVSGGLAIVRALGCIASVASLGIGFVPALLADGGRAIEDRLADTRVVRVPTA
jgi:uncharacterized RDD family membrane protein YckC